MDFAPDRKRAWKDIWGSGQGIGAIGSVVPAATLVDRLTHEYRRAHTDLLAS